MINHLTPRHSCEFVEVSPSFSFNKRKKEIWIEHCVDTLFLFHMVCEHIHVLFNTTLNSIQTNNNCNVCWCLCVLVCVCVCARALWKNWKQSFSYVSDWYKHSLMKSTWMDTVVSHFITVHSNHTGIDWSRTRELINSKEFLIKTLSIYNFHFFRFFFCLLLAHALSFVEISQFQEEEE